jgi:hypothetical protein
MIGVLILLDKSIICYAFKETDLSVKYKLFAHAAPAFMAVNFSRLLLISDIKDFRIACREFGIYRLILIVMYYRLFVVVALFSTKFVDA